MPFRTDGNGLLQAFFTPKKSLPCARLDVSGPTSGKPPPAGSAENYSNRGLLLSTRRSLQRRGSSAKAIGAARWAAKAAGNDAAVKRAMRGCSCVRRRERIQKVE